MSRTFLAMTSTKYELKLVIVGDGTIGKTCLIHTYCYGEFLVTYEPSECYRNYTAEPMTYNHQGSPWMTNITN